MDFKKDKKIFGQYYFDNHEFDESTDDYFEKTAPIIGYLIQAFNSLDAALNSELCMRINDRTDRTGAIIIHKMPFSTKVDLFNNLTNSMINDCMGEMPSFKKFVENLKKCAELRNAVVHAEWDKLDDKGYTYVKVQFDKNGLQQHYYQFTPESLMNAVEFIYSTYKMFDLYEAEKQILLNH